jgi:hypothetical protein
MKARTLIGTAGAAIALVGLAVQPAGAKVASSCAVSRAQVSTVGYTGSGWSYPVVKRVLVVGNGTKAPYWATTTRVLGSAAAKACGHGPRR